MVDWEQPGSKSRGKEHLGEDLKAKDSTAGKGHSTQSSRTMPDPGAARGKMVRAKAASGPHRLCMAC